MAARSPLEWLKHLEDRLEQRRAKIQEYEDYFNGDHRLAFATEGFIEAFGDLFAPFSDNWCRLVCDIPVARLRIEGFEFGDAATNAEAWEMWEDHALEARSREAHTEAVKCGESYILVDPTGPRVTIEHALNAYVECDPGNPLERRAGILRWADNGRVYANVYLPNAVYKFVADAHVNIDQTVAHSHDSWEARADEPVVDNPLGVVPLIPLRNNPSLLCGGTSDLDVAIPLNDAVNKLISDMMLDSEFTAFPQRVISGLEIETDDQGNVVETQDYRSARNRLLLFEEATAKIDQFAPGDMSGLVEFVNLLIKHLAAQTQIPPQSFLSGDMVNLSADAMQDADATLVDKVERKQSDFSPAWREALRLMFLAKGKTASGRPLWKRARRHSLSQIADALVKLRDIGVPYERVWAEFGATPDEIQEWLKQRGLPDRSGPTDLPEAA